MKYFNSSSVKFMCQQKRLNIGYEHYPETKGIKCVKIVNLN
jgi:hypothetical protein